MTRLHEATHGKVQQTVLQIKWSSICNELHIDETPQDLFSSLPFIYPTILNVIIMIQQLKYLKLLFALNC